MSEIFSDQFVEQLNGLGLGSFVRLLWYALFALVALLCVKSLSGLVGGVLGPIFSGVTQQAADAIAKLRGASKASDLEKRVERIEVQLGIAQPKPLTPEEENELLKKKLAELQGEKKDG